MGTENSKIDRSKIISDTQKALDQLDIEEMKNRELSAENESLRKTKDVLLEGNSELINKIRQLNTDASLYKVHHFEDDGCCNKCKCHKCDHYQKKDNDICVTCVHYQGQQQNKPPDNNLGWIQRNSKSLYLIILLISIIIFSTDWDSGPIFDFIQKSWIELFVNFFK